MPAVPAGFKVERFAENLKAPRQVRRAPNGDLFVMEQNAGQITILRGNKDGKPETTSVYATGLTTDFGINFYPERSESAMGLRGKHGQRGAICL